MYLILTPMGAPASPDSSISIFRGTKISRIRSPAPLIDVISAERGSYNRLSSREMERWESKNPIAKRQERANITNVHMMKKTLFTTFSSTSLTFLLHVARRRLICPIFSPFPVSIAVCSLPAVKCYRCSGHVHYLFYHNLHTNVKSPCYQMLEVMRNPKRSADYRAHLVCACRRGQERWIDRMPRNGPGCPDSPVLRTPLVRSPFANSPKPTTIPLQRR